MPAFHAVAFTPLLLKDHDLVGFHMIDHGGFDRRTLDPRLADGDVPFLLDEKDVVQLDLVSNLGVESRDEKLVLFLHAVLFASDIYNSVHFPLRFRSLLRKDPEPILAYRRKLRKYFDQSQCPFVLDWAHGAQIDDVPQIFTIDPLSASTPSKVICIGRNYVAHIRELENEMPDAPVVFLKPPSSIIPTGGQIVIPSASSDVHHEVELVAEIGSECKNVPVGEAMSTIRAYAVGLDMTARDLQSVAKQKGLPWTVAKGFDTFAPLGPLVLADGIDPGNLEIRLEVNGVLRQRGNTSLMIFSLPKLIAYVSTVFSLMPGDLIYTGTPEGVGPVRPGDRLVGTITGLPPLEVTVTRS